MALVPLCHVMVAGSMSNLTNMLTSSFVKVVGSVLLMPNFYGRNEQIREKNYNEKIQRNKPFTRAISLCQHYMHIQK